MSWPMVVSFMREYICGTVSFGIPLRIMVRHVMFEVAVGDNVVCWGGYFIKQAKMLYM